MRTVLVLANETLGGRSLLEAVRRRIDQDPETRFVLVVPQNRPRHGNVVYDEAVRSAAEVRERLAHDYMTGQGIELSSEIGDEDPYAAAMDGIAEHRPDEVIVSTHPVSRSGWMRRDLVERIEQSAGVPVEHVVVDLDREGRPFEVTLVVANRTVGGEELIDRLKAKGEESPHLVIVLVPQDSGEGVAAREARARLADSLRRLREAGLVCAGSIGDPDPYTAVMNALQSFRVDEIVISTLPETRSGWLRSDLIERVRRATAAPVEHVVVDLDASVGAGR